MASTNVQAARDRVHALADELKDLAARDELTAKDEARFEEIERIFPKAERELKEAEVRAKLASGQVIVERGDGSGTTEMNEPTHGTRSRPVHRSNPWVRHETRTIDNMPKDELRDRALGALDRAHDEATVELGDRQVDVRRRDQLAETIERGDREVAEWAVVAGDPAYLSAFEKAQRSEDGYRYWTDAERDAAARARDWVMRASLNEGVAAQGGSLVPIAIDPELQLVNTGAINPWDRLCRTVTGSTAAYRRVTTAGVTSHFDAESGVTTDNTFNDLSQKVITAHRGTAYVEASWELTADVPDLANQIGLILADGKARLEADRLCNGLGDTNNEPNGWLGGTNGLAATTASRVSAATNAQFGALVDPFTLANALPPRYHANGPAWTAHYSIGFEIRRQAAAGNGQGTAFWQDISDGGIGDARFLGYPFVANSQTRGIPLSAATASNDNVLVIGSWTDLYTIYRRVGMVTGQVFPVLDQATGRPKFNVSYYALWRVGGDVTNPDAARLLVV